MNRKEIKRNARNNIKRNYFRNVIIVFICTILLSGGLTFRTKNILEVNTNNENVSKILINKDKLSNSEIIDELLNKGDKEKEKEEKLNNKYTSGILSTFFNEITASGSLTFGLLNGINKLIFEEKIQIGILIIIGNIILFILSTLFIKVVEINKNRYFLEQRRYNNTKIDKILFSYKINKTLHLSYILFIKNLKEFLWTFTIVGYFIKHYEYSMIPYILAENPSITKKEAFQMSKELTNGEKFNLFKLDLSFIGWTILKVFTLNLSGIFYSDVYFEGTYAENYINIRNRKIDKLTYCHLLNDKPLNINEIKNISYPEEEFAIKSDKNKKWYKLDYNKNYSFETYILFFISFSSIGWIWEVFYTFINSGVFVNRGTMHGPWLPIYGWGGVLILFVLKKFRDNPFKLFITSFILCGIIEYGTAWYLETFKHLEYWNYDGFFLNIHGRVCLEGLLLFGIGGCGFVYILAPLFDNLYKKIKPKIKTILCIIIVTIFSIDFIYSTLVPNTGDGISNVHVEKSKITKEENMQITLKINNKTLTATLEDNKTTKELINKLKEKEVELKMNDYNNMEKVGKLNFTLPKEEKKIKTKPGDIILYQNNFFVIYYDENEWELTKLGTIDNITKEELKSILGEGSITVKISTKQN